MPRLAANLAPRLAVNLAPGFSANFPSRLATNFAFLIRKAARGRHIVLLNDRLALSFRHPDVGLRHDVLLRLPFAR